MGDEYRSRDQVSTDPSSAWTDRRALPCALLFWTWMSTGAVGVVTWRVRVGAGSGLEALERMREERTERLRRLLGGRGKTERDRYMRMAAERDLEDIGHAESDGPDAYPGQSECCGHSYATPSASSADLQDIVSWHSPSTSAHSAKTTSQLQRICRASPVSPWALNGTSQESLQCRPSLSAVSTSSALSSSCRTSTISGFEPYFETTARRICAFSPHQADKLNYLDHSINCARTRTTIAFICRPSVTWEGNAVTSDSH